MRKFYVVCDYKERANTDKTKPSDRYGYESIKNLINEINLLGFECVYFGGVKELIDAINSNKYDKQGIYLNFNDGLETPSKRGQTPILLELMKVSYSGSSPLTHLIISNKFFTSNYLKDKINDLYVPNEILLKTKNDLTKLKQLTYPIILKPNDEGSSLGINNNSICSNFKKAKKQYNFIKNFGNILAQELINGYEITNYFIMNSKQEILFNEPMIISKDGCVLMDNKIFTYEDKISHIRKYYKPTKYISKDTINKIKNITQKIARQLEIKTIGRIDYKLYNDKLFFIEANTVPAFSKTSDIGELCKIHNTEFSFFVKLIIDSL